MASQYEVSVSCHNLANKDFLSKSDPVAILLENVPHTKRFVELGRTELIKDCLNPRFVKKFRLADRQGEDPTLRVAVIDIDNFEDMERLAEQDYIGRAEFLQSQLTSSLNFSISLSDNSGEVDFQTRQFEASLDGHVTLELANHSFRLKDRAVFLEINRVDDDNDVTLAYRSEQSVTGDFSPIKASLFTLALGDRSRQLKFEYWRYCHKGDHVRLGIRDTSLMELEQLYVTEGNPLLVFDNCKAKKKENKAAGSLVIKYYDLRQ